MPHQQPQLQSQLQPQVSADLHQITFQLQEPELSRYLYISPGEPDVGNVVHFLMRVAGGEEINTDNTCKVLGELAALFGVSTTFVGPQSSQLSALACLREYRDKLTYDIHLLQALNALPDLRALKEDRLTQITAYINALSQPNRTYDLATIMRDLTTPSPESNLYGVQLRPLSQDNFSSIGGFVFRVGRRDWNLGTDRDSAFFDAMRHRFRDVLRTHPRPTAKDRLRSAVLQMLRSQMSPGTHLTADQYTQIQDALHTETQRLFDIDIAFRQAQNATDLNTLSATMGYSAGEMTAAEAITELLNAVDFPSYLKFQRDRPAPFDFDSEPQRYAGTSSAQPLEQGSEHFSILAQLFLAHVAVHCLSCRYISMRTSVNFGDIFSDSTTLGQALGHQLIDTICAAWVHPESIEDAILLLVNRNHRLFGLAAPLTPEDSTEIKALFDRNFFAVSGAPHYDEFLIYPGPEEPGEKFMSRQGAFVTSSTSSRYLFPPSEIGLEFHRRIEQDYANHPVELPEKNDIGERTVTVSMQHLLTLSDVQISALSLPRAIQMELSRCRAQLQTFLQGIGERTPNLAMINRALADSRATPELLTLLLTTPYVFVDTEQRTFNCTAYEYAYWIGNAEMCRLLMEYMNDDVKAFVSQRIHAIHQRDPLTGEVVGLPYSQRGIRGISSVHCSHALLGGDWSEREMSLQGDYHVTAEPAQCAVDPVDREGDNRGSQLEKTLLEPAQLAEINHLLKAAYMAQPEVDGICITNMVFRDAHCSYLNAPLLAGEKPVKATFHILENAERERIASVSVHLNSDDEAQQNAAMEAIRERLIQMTRDGLITKAVVAGDFNIEPCNVILSYDGANYALDAIEANAENLTRIHTHLLGSQSTVLKIALSDIIVKEREAGNGFANPQMRKGGDRVHDMKNFAMALDLSGYLEPANATSTHNTAEALCQLVTTTVQECPPVVRDLSRDNTDGSDHAPATLFFEGMHFLIKGGIPSEGHKAAKPRAEVYLESAERAHIKACERAATQAFYRLLVEYFSNRNILAPSEAIFSNKAALTQWCAQMDQAIRVGIGNTETLVVVMCELVHEWHASPEYEAYERLLQPQHKVKVQKNFSKSFLVDNAKLWAEQGKLRQPANDLMAGTQKEGREPFSAKLIQQIFNLEEASLLMGFERINGCEELTAEGLDDAIALKVKQNEMEHVGSGAPTMIFCSESATEKRDDFFFKLTAGHHANLLEALGETFGVDYPDLERALSGYTYALGAWLKATAKDQHSEAKKQKAHQVLTAALHDLSIQADRPAIQPELREVILAAVDHLRHAYGVPPVQITATQIEEATALLNMAHLVQPTADGLCIADERFYDAACSYLNDPVEAGGKPVKVTFHIIEDQYGNRMASVSAHLSSDDPKQQNKELLAIHERLAQMAADGHITMAVVAGELVEPCEVTPGVLPGQVQIQHGQKMYSLEVKESVSDLVQTLGGRHGKILDIELSHIILSKKRTDAGNPFKNSQTGKGFKTAYDMKNMAIAIDLSAYNRDAHRIALKGSAPEIAIPCVNRSAVRSLAKNKLANARPRMVCLEEDDTCGSDNSSGWMLFRGVLFELSGGMPTEGFKAPRSMRDVFNEGVSPARLDVLERAAATAFYNTIDDFLGEGRVSERERNARLSDKKRFSSWAEGIDAVITRNVLSPFRNASQEINIHKQERDRLLVSLERAKTEQDEAAIQRAENAMKDVEKRLDTLILPRKKALIGFVNMLIETWHNTDEYRAYAACLRDDHRAAVESQFAQSFPCVPEGSNDLPSLWVGKGKLNKPVRDFVVGDKGDEAFLLKLIQQIFTLEGASLLMGYSRLNGRDEVSPDELDAESIGKIQQTVRDYLSARANIDATGKASASGMIMVHSKSAAEKQDAFFGHLAFAHVGQIQATLGDAFLSSHPALVQALTHYATTLGEWLLATAKRGGHAAADAHVNLTGALRTLHAVTQMPGIPRTLGDGMQKSVIRLCDTYGVNTEVVKELLSTHYAKTTEAAEVVTVEQGTPTHRIESFQGVRALPEEENIPLNANDRYRLFSPSTVLLNSSPRTTSNSRLFQEAGANPQPVSPNMRHRTVSRQEEELQQCNVCLIS